MNSIKKKKKSMWFTTLTEKSENINYTTDVNELLMECNMHSWQNC